MNAIDLYLVVCIFLVFGALMEYAAILLLLKKRRKPKYTIDSGFKRMLGNATAVTGVPKAATAVGGNSASASDGAMGRTLPTITEDAKNVSKQTLHEV